tara:strand:+ start:2096 stop:2368 length:273 start_codon:yes stop_codon:yes gene_type:complete
MVTAKSSWVRHSRRYYLSGDLAQEKIDELNSLGFIWDAKEYRWQEGTIHLKRFVKREGHTLVPARSKEIESNDLLAPNSVGISAVRYQSL